MLDHRSEFGTLIFFMMKSLRSHLYNGDRWLALVSGMWVMACSGLSFTFAVYSPIIKSVLGYDQSQIQTLAVSKDIGESVGLVAGLISDMLPPWAILGIGALHNFIGFGGLWLVLSGYIPPLPFWQVFALIVTVLSSSSKKAIVFNSSCFLNE